MRYRPDSWSRMWRTSMGAMGSMTSMYCLLGPNMGTTGKDVIRLVLYVAHLVR